MSILHSSLDEITRTCRDFQVKHLYAFGSVLGETFTEDSDADFLVVFDQEYSQGAFQQYFGLKEALEDILDRSVDLLCYEAIRNPLFKEEVDNTKQLLYAA